MNGKIEDYIPVGYENRIPRWLLRDRTGLTDRMMRLEILCIAGAQQGLKHIKKNEKVWSDYKWLTTDG